MLDYGYRSKCCGAAIRQETKTVKGKKIRVWACVRCKTKDVDIVPKGGEESQIEEQLDFAEAPSNPIIREFFRPAISEEFSIELISFSFNRGVPPIANLLLDLRYSDNPAELMSLVVQDGRSKEVQEYVTLHNPVTVTLFYGLVQTLIDRYKDINKPLIIAIGCSAGKHRSVALVEWLAKSLKNDFGLESRIIHRDMLRA